MRRGRRVAVMKVPLCCEGIAQAECLRESSENDMIRTLLRMGRGLLAWMEETMEHSFAIYIYFSLVPTTCAMSATRLEAS